MPETTWFCIPFFRKRQRNLNDYLRINQPAVIAEVIDLIKGTPLDTGTYLDKLKRLTPNDQFKAANRDIAEVRRKERT